MTQLVEAEWTGTLPGLDETGPAGEVKDLNPEDDSRKP